MFRLATFALALATVAIPSWAVTKAKTKRKPAVSRSKQQTRSKRVAGKRSVPQTPGPERYKEIQQALADKGYYKGEIDGKWSPSSVDALKRFQAEQNLSSDGKLSSLSLIALGLGPKRLSAQAQPGTHP